MSTQPAMSPTTLGRLVAASLNVATGSCGSSMTSTGETLDPNSNPATETSHMVIEFSWGATWVTHLRSRCLIATDISRSLVVMADIFLEGSSFVSITEEKRLIFENVARLPPRGGPCVLPAAAMGWQFRSNLGSGRHPHHGLKDSALQMVQELAPCSINEWNMKNSLLLLLAWINNLTYFKFYFKGSKLTDGTSKIALIILLTGKKRFYNAEWQKWEHVRCPGAVLSH